MADGDDSRSLTSAQDAGPVTVAPRSVDTLAGIQMLRAIASIAVVIYHALDQSYGAKHHFPVTWMMMPGAAGVDIFFVISGLIMFHVTFGAGKSPISPVEFLKRRVLRIYPLYWILLLPFFAARAAGFLHNSPLTNTQVLTSFLLLPDTKRLMFPAWTLVYEMYFYVVFAVMLLARSSVVSILGTTAVIGLLMLVATALQFGALGAFLANPLALEFCMGLGVAWAWSRWGGRWPVPLSLGLAGFVVIALMAYALAPVHIKSLTPVERAFGWGLPSALVVAGFLTVRRPHQLAGRLLVFLGNASYAIYLTHALVMMVYGLLLQKSAVGLADQRIVVPAVVAVAIVAGVIVHLAVERPLIRMIRRATSPAQRAV